MCAFASCIIILYYRIIDLLWKILSNLTFTSRIAINEKCLKSSSKLNIWIRCSSLCHCLWCCKYVFLSLSLSSTKQAIKLFLYYICHMWATYEYEKLRREIFNRRVHSNILVYLYFMVLKLVCSFICKCSDSFFFHLCNWKWFIIMRKTSDRKKKKTKSTPNFHIRLINNILAYLARKKTPAYLLWEPSV